MVPAYPIKIGGGRPDCAQDDLKRLAPPIQDELILVCRKELRPFPRADDGADEGAVPDDWDIRNGRVTDRGWRWRRGITRDNRRRLDQDQPVERSVLDACEYLIVFHVAPVPRHRHGIPGALPTLTVWRVLHNGQLGHGIVRWAYNQPRIAGLRPRMRDQPTG